MKKKKEEKPVQGVEEFVKAVQTGMLAMDKRLKDYETKLKERDQQINDMAKFLQSQQQQIVAEPVVDPRSESGLDKPVMKGELFNMAKDVIQIYRNTQTPANPNVEMALAMHDKVISVFYEKMVNQLSKDGSSRADAGVA